MSKSVIIEEFDSGINCVNCNTVTVHKMQKIDKNGDGEIIGYYGECDVCGNVPDYNEEEMKEYKIDFACCDGGFEIIVSTNHTFKAKTEEEAHKIASDLEWRIFYFLNPYYDQSKKDFVIAINCNEYVDTAFISKFIIDGERVVNKNCFIEELVDEYEEYFDKYNVLTFESIAYGVNHAPIRINYPSYLRKIWMRN
ncbi:MULTISPECIES: hypothetical protein [Bacillus cereus group]|uniref:hypothetical protein n=1 Tax=Bacillus cereus group TaxID=86661 RepID=UPI000BF1EC7D|nr:hypothetical protein [Bacillus toyonensis]PEO56325.1 hypothetical protein CN579_21100 [Bacillus toyonensis]